MRAECQDEDRTIYNVVVNVEEQYSIWPMDKANPPGWRNEGKSGLKTECLAYVKTVWTNMRPMSLRMNQGASASGKPSH